MDRAEKQVHVAKVNENMQYSISERLRARYDIITFLNIVQPVF